jgi:hypothetical protein
VVRENAFGMLDADGLRRSLAAALGDEARFDRLWIRWMERRHGDEDLGVDPAAGLPGGAGGLEDLLGGGSGEDLGQLEDLLAQLLEGLEQPESR